MRRILLRALLAFLLPIGVQHLSTSRLTLPPCIAVARAAAAVVPFGSEFQVNTYTTAYQHRPAVASDSSGNFVVGWTSSGQDGDGDGVFGQRFASGGAALGSEFQVNTYTTGSQFQPAVASDSAGNFVVVWQSYGQDGYGGGVFGQRFASGGAPLGSEFQANTHTASDQREPAVASDRAEQRVPSQYLHRRVAT